MYVCMYYCMYVCYVCMHVCMYVCMYVLHVCMLCMYAFMHVCMYVQGYVIAYLHVQVLSGEYDEVRQLIIGAIRMRRKYMEMSLQPFYSTTALLCDEKLPPSSDFCDPL